ncbi:kinase-like protein [Hesseltinella vesiculosa]|uniref:Kinase-like protein n=1 Tax=Hesseltinella vesiculosa TaxID=101127 RepID=A0A1X2GKY3_9FUNG|nr:kinase-like protein [Hesseltinella vesiculosa]
MTDQRPIPQPNHLQDRLEIAVFETTILITKRNKNTKKRVSHLVNVFNIFLEDKQYSRYLVRYIDDFALFNEKVSEVFQKLPKVTFPLLDDVLQKQRHGWRSIFLKERHRSNPEKIETFLRQCYADPHLRTSSLLRDFLSAQREEDRVTPLAFVRHLLRQHHQDQLHDSILPVDKPALPSRSPRSSTTSHGGWTTSLRRMTSWASPRPTNLPSRRRNSMTTCSSISSLPSIARGPSSDDPLSHDLLDPNHPSRITIQHFQFIKVIGKGGMGKVFLVRKYGANQLLALKAIRKQHVVQENEVAHTLMERNILATTARISHPFLIRLHHAFQDAQQLFLVLDYHAGGDLATQLAIFGKFHPDRCRLYTAEIILGLQELHRLAILYRDLKPENILLAADGHIILTDFGLSKQFQLDEIDITNQRTNTFCGTAEYIAPEVLASQPYTIAVDFWSLGTILYEMLVGIIPFWAETHVAVYQRVLHDPLEFPEDMDPVTTNMIAGLLERNPLRRLGTGPEGPINIRSHPYFDSLEWPDVYYKRIKPLYLPNIQSSADFSHFDPDYLNMTPRLSPTETHTDHASDLFQGYSFGNADSLYMAEPFQHDDQNQSDAIYSIPFDTITQASRQWSSYDSQRDDE